MVGTVLLHRRLLLARRRWVRSRLVSDGRQLYCPSGVRRRRSAVWTLALAVVLPGHRDCSLAFLVRLALLVLLLLASLPFFSDFFEFCGVTSLAHILHAFMDEPGSWLGCPS